MRSYNCGRCGGQFEHHGTRGKLPGMCAPCKREALNERERSKHIMRRPCLDCGVELVLTGNAHRRRRCPDCARLQEAAQAKGRLLVRTLASSTPDEVCIGCGASVPQRQHGRGCRNRRRWCDDCGSHRRAARLGELRQAGFTGQCQLCGTSVSDGGKDGPCVDHRHDNGYIRGVVCNRCNHQLAVMDLRYTDPDLWRDLLAWSARGEPVKPVSVAWPRARRKRPEQPTLWTK